MALREFTDSAGTAWRAWDVPPQRIYAVARSGEDRRVKVTAGYAPERRAGADRRRLNLRSGLERGWVCFQSGGEKRRLAPPPPEWADLPETELEELCRNAAEADAPRLG